MIDMRRRGTFLFYAFHTCPGNEREDIGERGAEELGLLTRVLHCDHIEELQRLRRMKQEEGALRDSRLHGELAIFAVLHAYKTKLV